MFWTKAGDSITYEFLNPFKPTRLSIKPGDFFGRSSEIEQSKRAIKNGSILIEGAVGIGKSSLQAHLLSTFGGFLSDSNAEFHIAVGYADIKTVDAAADLILARLIEVDRETNKLKVSLGPYLSYESEELKTYHQTGRLTELLKKILEKRSLAKLRKDNELILLAIDEADKCIEPVTRLIRILWTHLDHQNVENSG